VIERINERRRAPGEAGFTLIELLVVIVILGILAAVVVFSVGGIGDKGQASACKIDTRTLRTAEEAYLAGPNSGGQYTDEATLVSGGFLSQQSTYHDITLGTGSTSFTVTVGSGGVNKCGDPGSAATLNAPVDGTTVF
jgi:prepilin-type N-terminal cleavage/methylation domain-containing protein